MRRSFAAIHVCALALWLGGLVFSFLLAKTLFDSIRPVCPVCLKATGKADLVACATCGALHHATCAPSGCGLEHPGSHVLGPPSHALGAAAGERVRVMSRVAATSLGEWSRVRVKDETKPPERRLLWRLDATSNALQPEERGEVPGACFELPREGVGDALARAFELSQALAIAMAIASLVTVFLTPPGGALRFIRLFVLAAALALAGYRIVAGHTIATKRLLLESQEVPTPAVRADFGASHGLSSGAGVLEAVLVLTGLVLALERRDPKPATAS